MIFNIWIHLPKNPLTKFSKINKILHDKIILLDVDSRPWDFQAEECSLRCAVDRFNHRRYEKTSQSAAAATARAAAAAAAAGGNVQDPGSNREIIVSIKKGS